MWRFASAFVLALAFVVIGAVGPGRVGRIVSAQELNPCALVTAADIEPFAGKTSVANGVSTSLPASGYAACRYTWGDGTNRFKLDVTVNDASRMFPGMSPDQIKQQLMQSVRAGKDDAIISDVGDAAVFTPDSPAYAGATALVKGRILQVHLDGLFAGEKKDEVVSLLKSAASRL